MDRFILQLKFCFAFAILLNFVGSFGVKADDEAARNYFHTDVLRQFSQVDTDAQIVLSIFRVSNFVRMPSQSENAIHRGFAAGPPVHPTPTCTITKNEVEELQNVIIETLNNATKDDPKGDDFGVTCKLEVKGDENCEDMIKVIMCGIEHLKDGFVNAVLEVGSKGEIQKWKSAYDDLNSRFQKDLDNLKASLESEYMQKVDILKASLQELQARLNELVRRLALSLRTYVSKIHNGTPDKAADDYEIVHEPELLRDIVTAAYIDHTYGSDLNKIVEDIIVFLGKLKHMTDFKIGLEEFQKLLKNDNQNIQTLQSISLITTYSGFINSAKTDSLSNEELQELSEKIVDVIADSWVPYIKSSQPWAITDVCKANVYVVSNYPMLRKAVIKAYNGDLKNFGVLFFLMQQMSPWTDRFIQIIEPLVDEMKKHNHIDTKEMVKLAYYVHFKTDRSYPLVGNNFPSKIRHIFWAPPFWDSPINCTIQNKATNGYLYVDRYVMGDFGRHVYAIAPGFYEAGNWLIESKNDGETFEIINTMYENHHLYVYYNDQIYTDEYDAWKWKLKPQLTPYAQWYIIPRNNADGFLLQSFVYGGNAYGVDGEYQFARYSKKGDPETDHMIWEFDCK